jgi:paired small multidrug resistance pump
MGIDIEPYDIVGFAGAAVFVAAYFANQQRWLRSDDWRYPFANLVGAVLILVSLVFEWNFPSVVIEVFCAIISVYGMAKSRRERASP